MKKNLQDLTVAAATALALLALLTCCGRTYPVGPAIGLTETQRHSYAVVTRNAVYVVIGDTTYEYRRQLTTNQPK